MLFILVYFFFFYRGEFISLLVSCNDRPLPRVCTQVPLMAHRHLVPLWCCFENFPSSLFHPYFPSEKNPQKKRSIPCDTSLPIPISPNYYTITFHRRALSWIIPSCRSCRSCRRYRHSHGRQRMQIQPRLWLWTGKNIETGQSQSIAGWGGIHDLFHRDGPFWPNNGSIIITDRWRQREKKIDQL